MMELKEIDELIKAVSKFPGLGPKSAKRIILKLINNKDEIMKPAINALANVYKNISRCNYCGALKSSKNLSGILTSSAQKPHNQGGFSALQP